MTMGNETVLLLTVQEENKENKLERKRVCAQCKTEHSYLMKAGHELWYTHKREWGGNENLKLCYRCYARNKYHFEIRAPHTIRLFFRGIDSLLKKYREEEQEQQRTRFKQLLEDSTDYWSNRDPIDINALILAALSQQKRFDTKKDMFRKNKWNGFSNMSDLISLTAIKKTVRLSTMLFRGYLDKLQKYGFMVIESFEIRNKSNNKKNREKSRRVVKKLPRITTKGLEFLRAYQQVKDLLLVTAAA